MNPPLSMMPVYLFSTKQPEELNRRLRGDIQRIRAPGQVAGASVRFLLSPEDGFEPSHTYLLRVVQTNRKSERILAEGVFHLE
jgi:hypothetical protein